MTDKEKLIDILKGAERKVKDINPNMPLNEWLDIYADHLIAEGVIVPPCKVGDVVYRIANDSKTITEERIGEIRLEFTIDDGTGWHNVWWLKEYNIGVTTFLTKEEAEAKLKERKGK